MQVTWMTITPETYSAFIRQNYEFFNYDGTIYTTKLVELVMLRFGSHDRTIRQHMHNLHFLGFVEELSPRVSRLNKDRFPDFVYKEEKKEVKT
jgi:hypothetical protein